MKWLLITPGLLGITIFLLIIVFQYFGLFFKFTDAFFMIGYFYSFLIAFYTIYLLLLFFKLSPNIHYSAAYLCPLLILGLAFLWDVVSPPSGFIPFGMADTLLFPGMGVYGAADGLITPRKITRLTNKRSQHIKDINNENYEFMSAVTVEEAAFWNVQGHSLLYFLFLKNRLDLVKQLLERDVEFAYADHPYEVAARQGNLVAIEFLMKMGIPQYVKGNSFKANESPAYFAIQKGHADVAAVLLKDAQKLYPRAATSLLRYSVNRLDLPLCDFSIKMGDDVNLDPQIESLLLWAQRTEGNHEISDVENNKNRYEITKRLIAAGADVNFVYDKGKNEKITALQQADELGFKKIAELLKKNGAK